MPGGDGTGPNGLGGWCTPLWTSGQMQRPVGLGYRSLYGRRFSGRGAPGMGGRGRGRMNMFYATGQPGWIRGQQPLPQTQATQTVQSTQAFQQPTKEQEVKYLEQESQVLKQELEQIKKRIEELRK